MLPDHYRQPPIIPEPTKPTSKPTEDLRDEWGRYPESQAQAPVNMIEQMAGKETSLHRGLGRESYIRFLMDQRDYAGNPTSYEAAAAEYDKNIFPYLQYQIWETEAVHDPAAAEELGAPAYYSPGSQGSGMGKITIGGPKISEGLKTGMKHHELAHGFIPENLEWAIGKKGGPSDVVIPPGVDYTRDEYREAFRKAGWYNLIYMRELFPDIPHYATDDEHKSSSEMIAWLLAGRSHLALYRPETPQYIPDDIQSIREREDIYKATGLWFWEMKKLLDTHPDVTNEQAADTFNKIIGFKQAPTAQGQKV